jgi:Spy/CpxP family protein refolding chaperone
MGLIFVVGMVTGAALFDGFRDKLIQPPGLQQMRSHWLMHLNERLSLTPDQQAKIQPIVDDAGNQIQALHRDEVDRLSKIMQTANDKIAGLLTPAQQAELKTMETERERDFSGHMHSWGAPHHSDGFHHDRDDVPPDDGPHP